jgi:mannose-6-phosphate isomerase-like protein (cupin superfamily)
MDQDYLVGSLSGDSIDLGRGGWLLGSFFDVAGPDAARHVEELEVKYWEFVPGEESVHQLKTSSTIEWSLILRGRTRARIGEADVILGSGDYVLIRPGVPNNLVAEVLVPIAALTIKSPSDPAAKVLVEGDHQ